MLCQMKIRMNETSCLAPRGLESAGERDKKHSIQLNHLFIVLCLQAMLFSQCYGKTQTHAPLTKEEREGRKEEDRREKRIRKSCKVKMWAILW